MSWDELKAQKKYFEYNLSKGFITLSSSPAGELVLFQQESNAELRLYVDYPALNEMTVRNRYALPIIQETFARIVKAKCFIKLDLRAPYNVIGVTDGEEW